MLFLTDFSLDLISMFQIRRKLGELVISRSVPILPTGLVVILRKGFNEFMIRSSVLLELTHKWKIMKLVASAGANHTLPYHSIWSIGFNNPLDDECIPCPSSNASRPQRPTWESVKLWLCSKIFIAHTHSGNEFPIWQTSSLPESPFPSLHFHYWPKPLLTRMRYSRRNVAAVLEYHSSCWISANKNNSIT